MDRTPRLQLSEAQASDIIARIEANGLAQVTGDEIFLLERFFLLNKAAALSERYERALREHGGSSCDGEWK
jgi:hypothetical protein